MQIWNAFYDFVIETISNLSILALYGIALAFLASIFLLILVVYYWKTHWSRYARYRNYHTQILRQLRAIIAKGTKK
jgi:predicted RND superfamily exporter protein